MRYSIFLVAFLFFARAVPSQESLVSADSAAVVCAQAAAWRKHLRLVDLHQHIRYSETCLERAVRIMDKAGIGIGVNLSGGAVTHKPGELSEFERNKLFADRLYPGRFVHYFSLDFNGWDEPDYPQRAVRQVDQAFKLGAAGLKEFKRLGLYLRDKQGKLIEVDDPRLDPVWHRCGELGMPVSIHVADPKAFWLPYDPNNERWIELKDHPQWWFGDPAKFPPWQDLIDALNRVIERHPNTTFVCVHFANNAEGVQTVERWLDRYPNMMADLAARIPEIGRHNPETVRQIFIKHQDRILFGTDFMVYNTLTLGSGGSGPPPTDADALAFFEKHWRWLETNDRGFEHMTPIQGDWTIDAIGLPASVLRKIYFDNARKLLARSLPPPVMTASKINADFTPNGDLSKPAWQQAKPVQIECQSRDYIARPELTTTVRALWSDKYLYLSYCCPFTQLTVFEPADLAKERFGLWDRDVVEAFIGDDPSQPQRYKEFEVAPNGEQLDLALDLPAKQFNWNSGFTSAIKVNNDAKLWSAELRIPLAALCPIPPQPGARWPINLYRCDRANNAFLAWNPTGKATFHAPEKFGLLELGD